MKRVLGRRTQDIDASVEMSVDTPAEIVEWKLAEGDAVFFHFKDLIGFSEGLRFVRITSMSAATISLGRIVYYRVEGPGTLYLKTRATAVVSTATKEMAGCEPNALVAWHSNVKLQMDAMLDWRNTMLSSYHLRKDKSASLVTDSRVGNGIGAGGGILRFAKTFLLPI